MPNKYCDYLENTSIIIHYVIRLSASVHMSILFFLFVCFGVFKSKTFMVLDILCFQGQPLALSARWVWRGPWTGRLWRWRLWPWLSKWRQVKHMSKYASRCLTVWGWPAPTPFKWWTQLAAYHLPRCPLGVSFDRSYEQKANALQISPTTHSPPRTAHVRR